MIPRSWADSCPLEGEMTHPLRGGMCLSSSSSWAWTWLRWIHRKLLRELTKHGPIAFGNGSLEANLSADQSGQIWPRVVADLKAEQLCAWPNSAKLLTRMTNRNSLLEENICTLQNSKVWRFPVKTIPEKQFSWLFSVIYAVASVQFAVLLFKLSAGIQFRRQQRIPVYPYPGSKIGPLD